MSSFNTLYLLPYFASFMLSFTIAIYAFRREQVTGGRIFALLALCEAMWTLFFILELIGGDISQKLFWDNVQWITFFLAPIAMLYFCIYFTRRKVYRYVLLVFVVPIICLVMIFVYASTPLIHPNLRIVEIPPFNALSYSFNMLTNFSLVYSYLIGTVGMGIMLSYALKQKGTVRRQTITVTLGLGVSIYSGFLMFLVGFKIFGQRDNTPFTMLVGNLIVAWAIFRYHLFNVIPVGQQLFLDSIRDMVIIVDNDDRVVQMNAATRNVISCAKYFGRTIEDVFPTWKKEIDSLRHMKHIEIESFYIANGEEQHIDLRVLPILDDKKVMQGRLVMVRDISQQKKLNRLQTQHKHLQFELEKEQELSDLKNGMMVRIGHEFRTPLAVIQTSATLLDKYRDRLSEDQRQAKVETIYRQISHIIAMLDEISLIMNNHISASQLYTESLNIETVCQSEIISVQSAIKNQVNFHVVAHDMLIVQGDFRLLSKAIFNVLANATIYSVPNGSVNITIAKVDNNARITIENQGIGILENEQTRIFQPFFRGSNIGELSGLGLGLTISQAIITAHGGNITLESAKADQTLFVITLPIEPTVAD